MINEENEKTLGHASFLLVEFLTPNKGHSGCLAAKLAIYVVPYSGNVWQG